MSEFFREDFLQIYKEAETSIWFTNISDLFHLTALWLCFCVLQQKHILGLKTRTVNTTCQVTAILHLYCLHPLYFFQVKVFILLLSINDN